MLKAIQQAVMAEVERVARRYTIDRNLPRARRSDVCGPFSAESALAESLEHRTLLSGVNTLTVFNNTDGASPNSGLIMNSGTLIGATSQGGANGFGEVYSLPTTGGTPTLLASFDQADGQSPQGDLLLDSGTLYGTTLSGGSLNDGEVYSLPIAGGLPTILTLFTGTNGTFPVAGLIASDGILYGTTSQGGANNLGEVFSLPEAGGAPTVLASFSGPDGSDPQGSLALAGGLLYGTTFSGGDNGDGTIFSVPITGSSAGPTVLASFNNTDGQGPEAAVAIVGNTLYSTASAGGANGDGVVFSLPLTGGTPTVLASFNGNNGRQPFTGLTLAGSTLFGTTSEGGANGAGEIYSLPLAGGTLSVLASFDATSNTIGSDPSSDVTLDASGNIFGVTSAGAGSEGLGTVYELPLPTVAPAPVVGNLDPTFASGGVASHDVGLTSTAGEVVQSNGATVIAGTAGTAGSETFAVTRYNADGSLDTTFGDSGVTDTSFGGDDQASAEALLPNGDILVAGTDTTGLNGQPAGSQFALAEYTSAGVLDTSFGSGTGQVLTSFSTTGGTLSNDVAHGLTVAPNGTIYVVGSTDANASGTDFAIAAFNADGSPATAFGTSGKATLNFQGGDDSANAVTVQSNGQLIVAGSSQNPSSGVTSIALARLLPDGALDTRFGTKGKVITSIGGVDDEATSVALQPKGQIVVGGESASGSFAAGTLASNFAVLRYTSTGKLDHSFDRKGFITTNFGQNSAVTNVLVQSNGDIVASGKAIGSISNGSSGQLAIAVARYNSNGTPDRTFSGTGQTLITLTGQSATVGLARPPAIAPSDAADALRLEFEAFLNSAQGIVATTPGGKLAIAGNSGGFTEEGQLVAAGIDLAASLLAKLPASLASGATVSITINVTEDGSVSASGVVTVQIFLAGESSNDAGQTQVFSKAEAVKLKASQAKGYKLKLKLPAGLIAGNYDFVADVDPNSLRDLNTANNIAFKGPFAVA